MRRGGAHPQSSTVAIDGAPMMRSSTRNMAMANGALPAKMSPSEMRGSASVLFTTNTYRPKGGVSRPISTAITVTMPNQMRLTW